MENKNRQEAKGRLLQVIPYFRKAISDANKKGTAKIGVISVNTDGNGSVEVQFEADGFFEDLAVVIDAPEQTEDDNIKAEALKFVQKHGLGEA